MVERVENRHRIIRENWLLKGTNDWKRSQPEEKWNRFLAVSESFARGAFANCTVDGESEVKKEKKNLRFVSTWNTIENSLTRTDTDRKQSLHFFYPDLHSSLKILFPRQTIWEISFVPPPPIFFFLSFFPLSTFLFLFFFFRTYFYQFSNCNRYLYERLSFYRFANCRFYIRYRYTIISWN